MKLSTLKRMAQQTTKARGHRMSWGQVFGRAAGPYSQNGECRDCGAHVWLSEVSSPNGIGVSGLAVAVNCTKKRS